MTKQHMWPAWLGRDADLPSYAKTPGAQHHRHVGDRGANILTPHGLRRLVVVPEESSVKNVHPGTHKFFNVCRTCNNGWMSKIEDDCRPIVKQLILDNATQVSQEQQVALAKWATLMAIMAEFTYPPNKAITGTERVDFYDRKEPASNFNIFLGKYQDTYYKQQHLHTGYEAGTPGALLNRPGYAMHANFQLTVFIIGSMLLFVASTSHAPLQPAVSALTHPGLAKIWPDNQHAIKWPPLAGLTDADVEFLYKEAGYSILRNFYLA